MSDPRWFKLLVRAIGLVLIGIAIPSITMALSYIPEMHDPNFGYNVQYALWSLIGPGMGGLLQLALGGYLFFGAPRLVKYCVRQVHTRCPGCDYDVRGLQGACPECGLLISHSESALPPHRQ